jgi:hypothetical protein
MVSDIGKEAEETLSTERHSDNDRCRVIDETGEE